MSRVGLRHGGRFLLACLFPIALSACAGGLYPLGNDGNDDDGRDVPDDDAGEVSFADDVQSILTTYCATCHRAGGSATLSGIALRLTAPDALDMLLNGGSVQDPSLRFVVPGDAGSSLLYLKVSSETPPVGVRMPYFSPPLSTADINTIRDWINQGAARN